MHQYQKGYHQNKAAEEFRAMAEQDDEIGQMIQTAKRLEGSVRNTGIHACGVIITPDDITKYVPVTTAKDSNLLVTQFDNSVVESAGLLKMDFLGLKTLTIIKDAIAIIKARHNVDIVEDDIPLNDKKTLELFSKGNTTGHLAANPNAGPTARCCPIGGAHLGVNGRQTN